MGVYFLRIPRWQPERLNRLIGCHWATKHRRKRADREMVAGYALAQQIPRAEGKRRVSLVVTLGPRQRGFDPDSPWKSLLDALVACGLLVDDSGRWVEAGAVTFERGRERGTLIILEDVE